MFHCSIAWEPRGTHVFLYVKDCVVISNLHYNVYFFLFVVSAWLPRVTHVLLDVKANVFICIVHFKLIFWLYFLYNFVFFYEGNAFFKG